MYSALERKINLNLWIHQKLKDYYVHITIDFMNLQNIDELYKSFRWSTVC